MGGFDSPGFNPTSKSLVIGLDGGSAWAVRNPRLSRALNWNVNDQYGSSARAGSTPPSQPCLKAPGGRTWQRLGVGGFDTPGFNLTSKRLVIGLGGGSA